MINPFLSLLEAGNVEELWDDLTFDQQQLLLEKLAKEGILTEPEATASVLYSRLGELSRLGAVMNILSEFILNHLSDDRPTVGPGGGISVI